MAPSEPTPTAPPPSSPPPSVIVGWELNARGKPGPRLINLSSIFNTTQLASQSVDFNVSLMEWRALPSLNIDKSKHTKCLLLGAGTLGCDVARALMGWGVCTITLVHNGRVSYSNPVRQSLFELKDCYGEEEGDENDDESGGNNGTKRSGAGGSGVGGGGGKFKAIAASKALKCIFPGGHSRGIILSMPMPGHSISQSNYKFLMD